MNCGPDLPENNRQKRQSVSGTNSIWGVMAAFALGTTLSGCMDTGLGEGLSVSRSAFNFLGTSDTTAEPDAVLSPEMENGEQSAVISGLLARQSILPEGPLSTVADAVLDANSRAAEADLRAARLRAEAAASNWLPSIGPQVSLTSLGSVIAGMVVEQAVFDNGRRRAERDYAAADVEVAAVNLAQDTNERVLEALELYVTAQAMTDRARVNEAAMERMEYFAYVMRERVRGGVSNPADLQIVEQKLAQMRSQLRSDQEAAASAMAELNAMASRPLDDVSGMSAFGGTGASKPLSVVKAEAESQRSIAAARAERAGFLPGVTATGQVTGQGADFGLGLGIQNGLGFGTGAARRAIDAQEAAAEARVGQVTEDTNRRLRSLESDLAGLQRQMGEARSIASQAAANYDIFAAQLREGQRTVNDVVGVFETKVRTERDAVVIQYEIAKVELQIAAIRGVLVDGDRI